MASKKKVSFKSKLNLLIFIILVLCINKTNLQITNFPDSFNSFDVFFSSMASNNFVYNAGFFTATATTKYLNKQAITLTQFAPATYCSAGSNINENQSDTSTQTSLVPSTSEFFDLWKNTIYNNSGSKVECKFPIYTSGNTAYTYTLYVPVFNNNASSRTLTVKTYDSGQSFNLDLFSSLTLNSKSASMITLTITQTTTTGQVTISALNGNSNVNGYLDTTGGSFLWLQFNIAGTTSDVRLSYFVTTLNTNGSTFYTRDGSSTCNSSTNPCLENYTCVGTTCKRCHASCLTCTLDDSNPAASTSCSTCARHTAGWKTGPSSGSCAFDYVDISQYQDISITTIEPPRTNRVTLSFWTFVPSLANFQATSNVIHFSIKDFLVVSMFGNSATTVGLYCTVYQKLKKTVELQTTLVNLQSQITADPNNSITSTIPAAPQTATSLDGKWFFTQCAMSFDHQLFYLNNVIDGLERFQSKTLNPEVLFTSPSNVSNDTYFRTVYRTGETLTLKILNARNIGTKIFIKNLYLFREYIPKELKHLHFNTHKIVTSAAEWPELLYYMGFDTFTFGGSFTLTSYSCVLPTALTSITTTLTPTGTPNLDAPNNFKRLDLISVKNKFYSSSDLNTLGNITVGGNQFMNFDNSKALTCNSNYWLELTTFTCNSSCTNPSSMTMYPGVSDTKGYCNFSCSASMSCPNTSTGMATLWNNFSCSGAGISNVYYNCVNTSLPNYSNLYYNSFYTPANIFIGSTILPAYKSYLIEVWYLPDKYMSLSNYVTTSAPNFANYIFYSNSMRIYINASTTKFMLELAYQTGNPTDINSNVNQAEWNKFIFCVLFDGTNYNMNFYVKNQMTPLTLNGSSSTATNQSLSFILFCHLDVSNCNGNSVYWASGLYKGLRVWDGDLAQPYTIIQYDDLYSSFAFTKRPSSIGLYYPLILGYLANNVLTDPGKPANNLTLTSTWNPFKLQSYNYSSKLDYIQATSSFTQYMSGISNNAVTLAACNSACKRCFATTSSDCYECNSGYFLSQSSCLGNGKNFFTSPSNAATPNDIDFKTFGASITPMGTITFWAKIIATASTTCDLIKYGANLKLTYDGSNYGTNANYGLGLVNSSTYLAKEPNFRNNFGKWTFFSLAYYDDTSTSAFFPTMLKFEINSNSYAILSTSISGISISQFTIKNNLYGLVANIKAYSNYIIGAYGYETNSASPAAPFIKPTPFKTYLAPGSSSSDCLSPGADTVSWTDPYSCSVDYDASFDTTKLCNNNNNYFTSAAVCATCPSKPVIGGTGCSTMCMNNGVNASNALTGCTCTISNNNSSMILKNANANICYRNDYVNFSKVNTITLTGVKTAKATEKYTLQFWVFAYNYGTNTFSGLTFKWNYHNKVDIQFAAGAYSFKCSPLYEASSSSFENSVSNTLAFTINAWNFISCAVDRPGLKYYMNTASNTYTANLSVSLPSGILSNTSTTLVITDNTSSLADWGVLFFRQITLWIDAFTTAGSLSRINIVTPTLFPNLINIWDPTYSGTNQLVDLTGSSATVTLTYSGSIGMNVVDDTVYSVLFLCSESGQYYDASSNTCIQFTDLSKVDNFSFTGIATSYFGDYTMEFWIFVEDISSLTSGVNIIWDKHITISVIKTTNLTGYCFPQAYSDDLSSSVGTQITTAASNARNSFGFTLATTSGTWVWVRCAVSNYNMSYYINTSGDQVLKAEVLHGSQRNDYPFKYYFPNGQLSTLRVNNINLHTKKIYLRYIYLFRDYLPLKYDFRYMDLSNMGKDYFPSIVFATNFANFDLANKKLRYSLYDYGVVPSINLQLTVVIPVGSTFALAANFSPLPLCDPASKMKYDSATNTCKQITSCVNASLFAWYCTDENVPLTCYNNYYMNLSGTTQACTSACPTGVMRTPGSVGTQAICNTTCGASVQSCPNASGLISAISSNFACSSSFDKISYQCSPQANTVNSAIFFSRCYQMPNIYRDLSVTTTSKLSSGHILEFWFKIDPILNTCTRSLTTEYYLYAPPHSIYKDVASNNFFYQIVGYPAYTGQLPSIQKFEWNRIMIKVTITSGVQYVYVFVNYGLTTPEWSNSNLPVPASINMQMATISFCSNSLNGNCINGSTLSIEWGSAYYKNFRIWDVSWATEWLIQAYNNKLFTENLKSLIVFYPFTVNTIDINKLTNSIGNYDHIVYTVNYSGTNKLYNIDNPTLINYSTTYDWGVSNPGSYITSMTGTTVALGSCSSQCKRCYSSTQTSCYECNTGFVLKGQTCINITNYYMKVPVSTANTPVSLKIVSGTAYDLTKVTSFTMTFWIKFFGINSSSASSSPYIVSLSSNTYLAYDTSSKNLIFSQNSVNAFIDTNWSKYIGQWVLITFSNYISNSINTYYPNMMTLSVNKIDIPMQVSYTLPSSGVPITEVKLGFEIVALFTEFRFYSNFIQGAYGTVSATPTTKSGNLIFMISLSGNSASNCISDSDLASGTVTSLGISCQGDYNNFLDTTLQCNDDTKYLDVSLSSVPPCSACNSQCTTLCFGASSSSCTCDLSQGFYWLRKDSSMSKLTYCEPVPNIDFSILNQTFFPNVKGSLSQESTLEFWVFIYSYNTSTNQFKQIDLEWDLHNKVSLVNISNSLSAKCFVLFDKSNVARYSETITQTLTFYKWNLVRCGTDLRNKQFFFNSVLNKMQTNDIPTQPSTTSFKIISDPSTNPSIGFVFIRELKLWQQFNYKYIDTSYITLTPALYPGLLHYFKNTFGKTVTTIQDSVNVSVFQPLSRRVDFKGYNYVDPANSGLYSELVLCPEGKIYNPTTLACITPSATKCSFPGDINDNCITCVAASLFIRPDDGSCVSTCPPNWFGNTNVNQCRPCDSSCYQCSDIWPTSCTACTGSLFLVPAIKQCVSNCEQYGLTKSLTTPNLCVIFDASANLVNVSPDVPINPFTFNNITAQVVGATAPGYTTFWSLNSTETTRVNNYDTKLKLDPLGPFSGNRSNLLATLNPGFFQIGYKYNFFFDIIKSNDKSQVTVTKNWTLTMNQVPQNGKVTVTPVLGLRNNTNFIINCLNWIDENSLNGMRYRFYSVENNTSTQNVIQDWTSATEANTVFNVRFYQLPSTGMTVYCDAMDSMGAINSASTSITIVNSLSSDLYTVTKGLTGYSLPSTPSESQILSRSYYLKSLGTDTFKDIRPEIFRTVFSPSLDETIITFTDPTCTAQYCNGKGSCDIVDKSIACYCDLGYVGSNCHVDKSGYKALETEYFNLYNAINMNIASSLTWNQLTSMWNLYSAASTFFQDPSFFSSNLNTFMTLVQNSYMDQVVNSTSTFFDFFDFYIDYTSMRQNQLLIKNKNATVYPYRNITLQLSQQPDFSATWADITKGLNSLITKLIQKLGTSSRTITYKGNNVYIAIAQLTPVFNETSFFSERIKSYKSWVTFMKCINYIQITRLNNPYYVAWFAFVEYQTFPYSYDPLIYVNNTSPMVELFFIDATTGKTIIVQGCDSTNPITFYMPFTSLNWLENLNAQKWLYNPNNYKSPDDPIFSSPIYINSTGFISDDTVEDRIKLYHRKFNFTCQYYDAKSNSFSKSGVNYTNFTSNYIAFNSSHLTSFTTFFLQNDVEYQSDGRFFYLKNPQIFLYSPNYWTNYAWFVIFGLLLYYFSAIFILCCYDYQFFRQESLLEFVKKEVIKVQAPYDQKVVTEINDLVPSEMPNSVERNLNSNKDKKNGIYNPERYDVGSENNNDVLNLNKQNNETGGGDLNFNFDDEDKGGQGQGDRFDNLNNNDIYSSKKRNMLEQEADSIDIRDNRMDKDDLISVSPSPNKNNFLNNMDKFDDKNLKFGNYIGDLDMYTNNRDAPDPLSNEVKNEEEDYEDKLEAFMNLNLSSCEFLRWNLKQRHVLVAPLINLSVFNPRWKKLTMFLTECASMMLLMTVLLTENEDVYINFSSSPVEITNINMLIAFCILSVFVTSCLMYFLAVFFRTSTEQRRRLYKVVTSGAQLLVLKEWEAMNDTNSFYSFFGIIFNLVIILGSFYASFAYVAVWNGSNWTWLLGFSICFFLDIILLEFLVEWFISLLYWRRKKNAWALKLAEVLNRIRSYRTLWP